MRPGHVAATVQAAQELRAEGGATQPEGVQANPLHRFEQGARPLPRAGLCVEQDQVVPLDAAVTPAALGRALEGGDAHLDPRRPKETAQLVVDGVPGHGCIMPLWAGASETWGDLP